MEDIKLDVQEAREARTDHPQWDFEVIVTFNESVARSRMQDITILTLVFQADEDEEDGKDESEESEYATDDDFDEDESD